MKYPKIFRNINNSGTKQTITNYCGIYWDKSNLILNAQKLNKNDVHVDVEIVKGIDIYIEIDCDNGR